MVEFEMKMVGIEKISIQNGGKPQIKIAEKFVKKIEKILNRKLRQISIQNAGKFVRKTS